MLFNYEVIIKEETPSFNYSITKWYSKYKVLILTCLSCTSIALISNIIFALVFAAICYGGYKFYSFWQEIPNLDFTSDSDELTLSDIINELERN